MESQKFLLNIQVDPQFLLLTRCNLSQVSVRLFYTIKLAVYLSISCFKPKPACILQGPLK